MRRFLFSAWGISLGVHLVALALVAGSMQAWPQGAGDGNTHSMGIVLNHSGDDGKLRNGDDGEGDKLRQLEEVPEAPELLPTPVAELPTPTASETHSEQFEPKSAVVSVSATQAVDGRSANGRGRSGTQNGTGEATVSVFGVAGHGRKFLYLFDRSASMEGAPLSAAKRQLVQSLQSLGTGQQFHIMFFNTKTQAFAADGGKNQSAFATDRNKQLAANFVGGITADGGTDRMIALQDAIACGPDVIFFLTDADDPMSRQDLSDIARLNRRVGAAICVIEFGNEPESPLDNFLMRLASESGGRYGYVDPERLRR